MSNQSTTRSRNDEIRRTGDFGPGTDNPLLATPGVLEMGADVIGVLYADIMTYDKFAEVDNPSGNHDFGVLSYEGTEIWFKIDQSPDNPENRIFTILLPSEY